MTLTAEAEPKREVMVDKDRLEASICRDSFFSFVQRFWDTIITEDPIWNWHIPFICNELQIVAERVFKREPKEYDLFINVSPGSTKSTICSVMFPIWCWTRDTSIRTICGSYAFPLSLHLATQSRTIVQSEKFHRLFPEVELKEAQKSLFITTTGGQRIATSTGGSVTGMHGHFLIVDDPINPKEAVSPTQLASANDWIDQTLMTRKIDKLVTPLILIMQRLHQSDPTGYLLKKRKGRVRHICLPAELATNVRPRSLRRKYVDGLMDPVRLSKQVLKEAKEDLGEYGYAGQFGQRPVPLSGGMFKTEHLEIIPFPPRTMEVVRYWDKAGTHKGGAYTVGVKMGWDKKGRFVVLNVVRGQWEASARESVIKSTTQIDGRGVAVWIEQEPGSGGKESAQSTVKNLAGYLVRVDRPTGDKVYRADPFAVQVNGGNVVLVEGEWNQDYISELSYFPFGTYKDQVDGSSGAFNALARVRKVGALGR